MTDIATEGSDEEKIVLPADTSLETGYESFTEYVLPIPGTEGAL